MEEVVEIMVEGGLEEITPETIMVIVKISSTNN
jgi:hypothetical protein